MLQKILKALDKVLRRYTPDPFVIAIGLTLLVILLSSLFTASTPLDNVRYWGDGFWSLITFTLQMVMILFTGYIVAASPPVKRLLQFLAKLAKTPGQAIVLVSLVSAFGAYINWGLGLVVGAFFALETARVHKNINFRVLVASAYSGFLFWHGGLSGSIPLVVNTPGNFSQEWVGGILPVGQTLFSGFNLTTLFVLAVTIPALNWYMHKLNAHEGHWTPALQPKGREATGEPSEYSEVVDRTQLGAKSTESVPSSRAFSEWLENHRGVSLILFVLGLIYVVQILWSQKFTLDLNSINFIFLFLGLILHKTPRSFLKAVEEAAGKLGPLLVQYPLYAGIMGVMVHSGLAEVLSVFFVEISNKATLPLMTFWSAGLVNLFIPSGGGQWAVQAPVMLPAAQELGADIPLTVMAVAWGDAWTNMLQPFWALPLLAIANIQVKEILGFCFMVLVASGVVISGLLLAFAWG